MSDVMQGYDMEAAVSQIGKAICKAAKAAPETAAAFARRAIEADTGRPAVTAQNAAQLNAVVTDVIQGVAEADKPNEDEK